MSTITLIDLSIIFRRNWHSTADQPLSEAYERTISAVNRYAGEHTAVCLDAPPYFRKAISAEYKANRDAPEPNMVDQFRRVQERLGADGFLLWKVQGMESDDLIASATKFALERGHDVTIVSSDKDLTQLLTDYRVVMRRPDNGEVLREPDVLAKFGVPPAQMRDWLALVGDASDNVAGVPGVGPKTAAKLLHDFDSIDGILENLRELPKGKLQDALEANREQLKLSRELVTLRTDVPLNFDELFQRREPQHVEETMSENFDSEDNMDADEPPESDSVPAEIVAPIAHPSQKPSKPEAITVHSNGNGAIAAAPFEQGLQPGSLGAAYKLAKGLAASRLYSRFPNAESVWAIIIRGREMGLGALTALDSFFIVEGKPYPSAHLLIARAKAHPQCEYFQFIGGDANFAEYETKHRGNPRPTRLKYTIEQARRAGLVRDGSNWTKRPEEMLRKSTALQLARIEYPEVMQGTYAAEEVADD